MSNTPLNPVNLVKVERGLRASTGTCFDIFYLDGCPATWQTPPPTDPAWTGWSSCSCHSLYTGTHLTAGTEEKKGGWHLGANMCRNILNSKDAKHVALSGWDDWLQSVDSTLHIIFIYRLSQFGRPAFPWILINALKIYKHKQAVWNGQSTSGYIWWRSARQTRSSFLLPSLLLSQTSVGYVLRTCQASWFATQGFLPYTNILWEHIRPSGTVLTQKFSFPVLYLLICVCVCVPAYS